MGGFCFCSQINLTNYISNGCNDASSLHERRVKRRNNRGGTSRLLSRLIVTLKWAQISGVFWPGGGGGGENRDKPTRKCSRELQINGIAWNVASSQEPPISNQFFMTPAIWMHLRTDYMNLSNSFLPFQLQDSPVKVLIHYLGTSFVLTIRTTC